MFFSRICFVISLMLTALVQNPVIPRTVKLQPRLLIRNMSCYCNMPTPVAAMPMAVAVRYRPKLGSKQGESSDGPFGSGEDFNSRSTEMVVPCHVFTCFYYFNSTSGKKNREGSTPWERCVRVSKMFLFWPHSMAHQMSFLDYCNYPVCSKKSIVVLK